MCRTFGRICIRIGIVLISIRIQNGIHVEIWIRMGIKTMPIHNTGNKYLLVVHIIYRSNKSNLLLYICCCVLNAAKCNEGLFCCRQC